MDYLQYLNGVQIIDIDKYLFLNNVNNIVLLGFRCLQTSDIFKCLSVNIL